MAEGSGEPDVRPEDVIVVVRHPFGDVEVTLATWMAVGPGPRPLVRPVAARSRRSGEPLPLTVIPPRYRNDEQSRAAVRQGILVDPWAGSPGLDDPAVDGG
ncbi:MAG: hypothetical protein GEV28_34715 [Actinophytocola sp.]|uniref:hypothetical protein n=1 Tax=Actinophytocola sp. TaxID=1872138 RepID=UPI001325DE74|nr:hypothetical protein [Actinophytocola sp.]MPZ85264.1 hypothetical protein [Actinophytocola sp.]